MNQDKFIFDATESDFERSVIARSRQIPVIVDFWAEWCAPCRILGPVLEEAVREAGGRLALARVDVEASPELAEEFAIQSIPAVKIFSGGKVVREFVGALPAEEIRRLLAEVLPDPAEGRIEEAHRHLSAGRWEKAERIYEAIREREPGHPGAALGLGLIAYHQGRYPEAEELLAKVTPRTPGYDQVPPLRARMYFQKEPPPDMDVITAALKENPADPAALFSLALAYGRGGEYLRALDTLLEVLKIKKGYGEGAAREAYLKLLEIIGRRSPDGKRYERDLSMILFS
jgi:putative thioredoxin